MTNLPSLQKGSRNSLRELEDLKKVYGGKRQGRREGRGGDCIIGCINLIQIFYRINFDQFYFNSILFLFNSSILCFNFYASRALC